ncbi:MAG: shikimate kinase [candidate division Zixibacteria bacterium]|nr:shikimate kinase [candidate division Zixibacteria bacterium]
MKIYLIGFSCSGKTTIGPKLAYKLSCSFYDLDDMISKKQNKAITDIFKDEGEKKFRVYETDILSGLSKRNESFCVALGGGVFQSSKNQNMIENSGISVYLSCANEELYRRLKNQSDRPLLRDENSNQLSPNELKEKISSMMTKRKKNYLKANIIFSTTDKTVEETVDEIYKKISLSATN